ncbi:hypothetical protein MKZ38_000272 [Zalerion maritima]|uniref:Ribosomal RNA-processing protein 1 n=1 Tax=Zalerion maritima TaxID=339359 RepID=A0AAD5RZR8_9PEZI|nr:hypothetical protein MKZ38_000272 [Zalerion maritima]
MAPSTTQSLSSSRAETTKSMPFIKNLASSDRKLRTASLSSLESFLRSKRTSSRPLSQIDCLKLWKSLFFALWMTDRPLPQQSLCSSLSSLHSLLPPPSVPVWWSSFFAVMSAEWTTGIDVLRMNKFLLLVRRVLGSMLSYPKSRAYGPESCDAVTQVLREWPFETEGDLRKVPVGLRLHVLDIWVDELENAGALRDADADADQEAGKGNQEEEEEGGGGAAEFVRMIGELAEGLKRCPVKAVRERAKEAWEDERLPWNEKTKDEEEEDDDDDDDDDEEMVEGGNVQREATSKKRKQKKGVAEKMDLVDDEDDDDGDDNDNTWGGFDD